ncbi:MAG: hypothetical protein ACE5KZ_07555 [Candidatus Scalinduaceae bacterium]
MIRNFSWLIKDVAQAKLDELIKKKAEELWEYLKEGAKKAF